ncbi:hypothetical protein [Pseudomonas fontis]|uniref:DUF1120 domain-containing protein n=1 Tax=Pseudomonas fontis TaxID=2942633 RepID=A0ABT5NZ21_9PSED|nr:hypothetical protein [Pseudomonas fontis]MDD0977575.1 hypothetical protein [Pseudomonas fontis]MDD0993447.1 hypothetical protein [Pseudomonas fontis]
MRFMNKFIFAVVAAGGASSAFAATTATLQITGRILPPACDISTTMASLDLGNIEPDDNGRIPDLTAISAGTLNIACSAKTFVSVDVKGTMPVKVEPGVQYLGGWAQGNTTLSNMGVSARAVTYDGYAGRLIASGADGTWLKSTTIAADPSWKSTFAAVGSVLPVAVKNASVEMELNVGGLDRPDFSKGDITADQTLVFEVKYL